MVLYSEILEDISQHQPWGDPPVSAEKYANFNYNSRLIYDPTKWRNERNERKLRKLRESNIQKKTFAKINGK